MSKMLKRPRVIMLSTCARGGMSTVVQSYKDDGFFESQNIELISTHSDGSKYKVMWWFFKSYFYFLFQLIFKRPALIHIHSASKGSFWRKSFFAILAFLFRVPVIFHVHGANMESFYSALPKVFKNYVSWVLEKSNCVIVLSASWDEYIKKIAPKAHVEIVNNYVALPPLSDVDKCIQNKSDKVVTILFLGMVGERKGIYDIIDAISLMLEKTSNFRVLIGGNGDVEQAESIAKKKSISDVITFLGWVDGKKKEELLGVADIYILPSYNEGLPMSLLEAMSWSIPVISTSVGGIPELVRNDVDGFVIEPGDVQALSSKLLQLIYSCELRVKMGGHARERIEGEFSDLAILPKLERIYQKLL